MTVIEYHRPDSIERAYRLLERKEPVSIPLGGGTGIDRYSKPSMAVVDLQNLGLNHIEKDGHSIKAGAATPLETLVNTAFLPEALIQAIRLEATLNQRQMATLAGRLVTSDGTSPLATVLLSMEADLIWGPGEKKIGLGEWLPLRQAISQKKLNPPGLLITRIEWDARAEVVFDWVGRSPYDRPIINAGVSGWSTGRRRVVLGGIGEAPKLVIDGPDESGILDAVRSAYSHCGDEWASAEYRQELAATLVSRALKTLAGRFAEGQG